MKEKGLKQTLKTVWYSLLYQFNLQPVLGPIIRVYWDIRRVQNITIGGARAKFDARVNHGGRENRLRVFREYEQLVDFVQSLQSDDTVYDIGANTGLYACFAGVNCSQGSIYAFEPYSPNVRQLERNLEYNSLQNVESYEIALSDTDGNIQFEQPSEDKIGYGSASIGLGDKETVEVPARSVDEMISQGEIEPANVVKIDVEGAEPLVLLGMENFLSSDACRLVYCEYHLPDESEMRPGSDEFGMSLNDMKEYFEDFGYDVEEFDRRANELVLKCTKNGD